MNSSVVPLSVVPLSVAPLSVNNLSVVNLSAVNLSVVNLEVTKEEVLSYVSAEYPTGKGGDGYKKNLIRFLKTIVGRPINSTLLLEIPSKNKEKQNYCNRRWEEIYSLDRLLFVNWNHPEGKKIGLTYGQWCLISDTPMETPPANRGVNKKIASTVFARDHSTCVRCGAKAGQKHHLFPDKDVQLHVGHIVPFIAEDANKKYTAEDFITLCSMCNEGEKADTVSKEDRINLLLQQIERLKKEVERIRTRTIT